MNLEQSKAFIRNHFEELVNRKNHRVIYENLAENFVDHDGPTGGLTDRESNYRMMTELHRQMPDFRVRIEDMIAEGDKVVCQNVWTGTRPDGSRFEIRGIVIWRIAGGKIVERWASVEN